MRLNPLFLYYTLYCTQKTFPKLKNKNMRSGFKGNYQNTVGKPCRCTNKRTQILPKMLESCRQTNLRGVNLSPFSKVGSIITGAERRARQREGERDIFEKQQEAGFYQLFISSTQRSLCKTKPLLRKNNTQQNKNAVNLPSTQKTHQQVRAKPSREARGADKAALQAFTV